MQAFLFLLCGLVLTSLPLTAHAQEKPAPLGVDRVILSTAGLAHIEHSLDVDGDQSVSLPLRLEQVDDVMKSLVIFDAKGGLGGVTLPGRQPLAQAFRDVPFSQSDLANPILLLNAYQGAKITVTSGGSVLSGQLVQVTPEQKMTGDGMQETRYRLTLMTAEGLRRLWLDEAQSLQFDDATVKAEITKALSAVRDNATAAQRDLTIALTGEGRRSVRLAYVVDAPLWKAAYRLVMPAVGGDQGLLQGWAVVENMTAGDWDKVDLTLVSGNPVTFRQQLYQSYYVDRPEIPVEVLGRVMPRMDAGVVGQAGDMEGSRPRQAMLQKAPSARAAMESMAMDSMAMAESAGYAGGNMAGGTSEVAQGVNAAASAEATTQVLFHFPTRVSLAAGQSLLLPFLSQDVAMERVSVYQPDTHPRHPLAAVALTNKSDSGLPPGVLTLYEESAAVKGTAYVGDARLPALSAGEKRLVSYALDSKVTVDRTQESDSRQGSVTLAGGVIRVQQTMREKTAYTVTAPAKEARVVILEHPRRGDFKLISPAADDVEVTDGFYRIRLALKAGETVKTDVVLEREVWQSHAITSLSLDELLAYAGATGGLDSDTQKVFADMAKTRRALDAVDAQLQQLEQERSAIFADQARVRENLQSLGDKSDLHQRYLKKLDDQESRLGEIDASRADLQQKKADLAADLKKKITVSSE